MVCSVLHTGEQVLLFFQRPLRGGHRPYITTALLAVLTIVFCFMAGQYTTYKALVPGGTALQCLMSQEALGLRPWGPSTLIHQWLSPSASQWQCLGGSAGVMDGTFLIDWGARWSPAMSEQASRITI